jgi:hypothetical protein
MQPQIDVMPGKTGVMPTEYDVIFNRNGVMQPKTGVVPEKTGVMFGKNDSVFPRNDIAFKKNRPFLPFFAAASFLSGQKATEDPAQVGRGCLSPRGPRLGSTRQNARRLTPAR